VTRTKKNDLTSVGKTLNQIKGGEKSDIEKKNPLEGLPSFKGG